MAAIITHKFRYESALSLVSKIKNPDESKYYVGLGKTEPWFENEDALEETYVPYGNSYEVPLAIGTLQEEKDVRDNLIKLIEVMESHLLSPKNRWNPSNYYKTFNMHDPMVHEMESLTNVVDLYPTGVRYHDNVYVCLSNNDLTPSTVAPTRSTYGIEKTSDGYVWAFVQTIDASLHSAFYDEEFIPVGDTITAEPLASTIKGETGGMIYAFDVENGGSDIDYTIVLKGIGEDGVKESVTLSDHSNIEIIRDDTGVIKNIKIKDLINNSLKGYLKANIEVFNVDVRDFNVVIKPIIAPIDGFGADPKLVLPAYYAGCSASFNTEISTDFITKTAFRQVSLIKDPTLTGVSNSIEINPLNCIRLTTDPEGIDTGDIFRQQTTGARAFVDAYDSANKIIYYHQNSDTKVNYIPFDNKNDIIVERPTEITIEEGYISEVFINKEYVHDTGDVLFVNNRSRIFREEDQIENVKMVIQF